MRYILFILTISFAYIQAHAQTPRDSNPTGWFTVDEYQGCSPLAVTISTSKCSSGCTIIPDNNVSKAKVVLNTAADSFVFYSPGIHKIKLIDSNGNNASIQINVVPNTPPAFILYACNSDKAMVNILDVNFDNYKIQYPPATTVLVPKGSPPAIISLPAGTNNIKVTGNNIDADNSQCLANTQTVFAQAALDAPVINQLTVVSDKEIDLTFPLASDHHEDYTQYQLDINTSGGAFTPFTNVYNQSSATITGISADNSYYCFRLTPFDKCTQTRSAQQSNTICSIRFRAQDIVVGNKENDLTWLTAQPDANFTIKRAPDVDDGSVAQTYQHKPVNCGTVYSYQIISNYSIGAKSYSEIRQATGNSTDPAADINNLSVSLNEDASVATLLWDAGVQAKEYSIFRNQNLLKTTDGLSVTDDKYTMNDCYEVSYKDNCGNSSAKIEACPIILKYTLRDDNTIDLNWNAYASGWKNGVSSYQLEKYSAGGDDLGPVYDGSATNASDASGSDSQVFMYRIVGKPNDLIPDVLSNVVIVVKSPHIYYPTAFSPGSSTEVNQKFNVFGTYIESFEMQIFNRWGEMIFATKDKNEGWDGTYLGTPVPPGIYAFIARITDTAGEKITKSGSVALIRKK